MNKKLLIILALLALLVVVMFSKNLIAKTALSAGVKAITGLNLSMKSMNVEIFKTLIGIKELKLYNPSGFPDKLMIEMPEIYIDYDLGSFLGGRAHFEEIRLNIKEFFVVKNENGELNLNSLKIVKAGKEGLPKEEKKEAAGMPELKIDILQLKIGKVIYKDYSAGRAPKIREFKVNIDEKYKNITDPRVFASLIITKALMNTTIASLTNFDLGPLTLGLGETLKGATKITTDVAGKTLEAGKEIGKEAVETVGKAIDKTGETIKKILPFGK